MNKKTPALCTFNTKSSINEILANQTIEDLVINPVGISVYSNGQWHGPIKNNECSDIKLQKWVRYIAEQASLSMGLTQPSVDSYILINDQPFRAHVVISPMVTNGPEITLRRLPTPGKRTIKEFCATEQIVKTLTNIIINGESLLISGSTGSGKTTLLNTLLELLPKYIRVIILEDSLELPIPNKISTKLISRNNKFGFRDGVQWELGDLVYESLRMRPDRLVLGECRGSEAYAITSALRTGHEGLITTIHSGSCKGALERFNQLAKISSPNPKDDFIKLFHWVVQIKQSQDGLRKITEIYNNKLDKYEFK